MAAEKACPPERRMNMALRAIMLRKNIERKKEELEALLNRGSDFERREAEIETAIEEASTPEEQAAVDEAISQYEADKKENDDKKRLLEKEIGDLEEELRGIEENQADPAEPPAKEERKADRKMNTRTKFFGMDHQERDAFFAREDVKGFLERVRAVGAQNRSVTGGELLIPTVMLDLIKENITEYSKLYKHVNVKMVPGKARQTVMGVIPEAVWTEACANLNELNFSFSAAEVDGYMVGGCVFISNATLQDSDVNLAYELVEGMGKSIGFAVDKAIVYGTGVKMPLGIIARLAQTTAPSNYPKTARAWEDLHTKNLLAITGKTDAALFKEIIQASGAAKGRYSNGNKFWVMNEATRTKLLANSVSVNAAGSIVAGMNGTMPVIGGAIEVLEFMPDDVIVGGYGDLYLLAEREGTMIDQSEHVRFVQTQTAFRGIARYDGMPVIAEGFVAIGIGGTAPTADAVTFAPDDANKAE